MLTDKQLEILHVLDALVIMRARQMAILVGQKEETVVRRRINKLEADGLVRHIWKDGYKAYYLTQRGLQELEKTRKEYSPVGYSTEHKIYISEVAAYIHLKDGISYNCMVEDKAFKNMRLGHAPDLAVGDTCYEVELNTKSHQRLEKNIKLNGTVWQHQIWIVPERKTGIKNNVKAFAKKNCLDVTVLPLEEIQRYVKEADLSNNAIGKEIKTKIKSKPQRKESEVFE